MTADAQRLARLIEAGLRRVCADLGHELDRDPAPGCDGRVSLALGAVGTWSVLTRGKSRTEVWRMEGVDGQPVRNMRALSSAWYRAPFALALRLVRRDGGGSETGSIGAVIGTRVPYPALVERIAEATITLFDKALRHAESDPLHIIDAAETINRNSDGDAIGALASKLRFHIALWQQRLFREWWTIGTAESSVTAIAAGGAIGAVKWLQARPGQTCIADPLPWPGTSAVLCEAFESDGGLGRLVSFDLRPDGRFGSQREIMKREHHLSYPFALIEDGQVFLVPEMHQANKTCAFLLGEHGSVADERIIIPNRRLVDSTIFLHGGLYWLAASDLDIDAYDSLVLFWSSDIKGPWTPHPGNPVKIDVRSARPAGPLFRDGSRLYRPAQDCSRTYGGGITINEILELTPSNFRERPVASLRPDPSGPLPHGLHTIAEIGGRTVIDGKRHVFRPGAFLARTLRRLSVAKGTS